MRPILFSIGAVHVPASAFFFGLSCLIGLGAGWKAGKRIGYTHAEIIVVFVGAVLMAYILGKGNAWLFDRLDPLIDKDIHPFFSSGFVSFGAIWGALAFGGLFAHFRQRSAPTLIDVLAGVLPLIESIYRIGCLLTGCCYGKETSGWGGLYLPDIYGKWAMRYPTQLLYMAFTFVLFLWLCAKRKHSSYAGSITVLFLGTYSAGRLLIDFLRDGLPSIGILSYHQITAIGTLIAAAILHYFFRKSRKSAEQQIR